MVNPVSQTSFPSKRVIMAEKTVYNSCCSCYRPSFVCFTYTFYLQVPHKYQHPVNIKVSPVTDDHNCVFLKCVEKYTYIHIALLGNNPFILLYNNNNKDSLSFFVVTLSTWIKSGCMHINHLRSSCYNSMAIILLSWSIVGLNLHIRLVQKRHRNNEAF